MKHMIKAPILGWFKLGLGEEADIPEQGALVMDNMFPQGDKVSLRSGWTMDYEITGTVNSIYGYEDNNTLIAGVSSEVYINGDLEKSGFANDEWQFSYSKGRAFMCNGADTMQQYYDTGGSVYELQDSTFSGTTLEFSYGGFHNGEFIGIKPNATSFWYGGVGNISGTLTEFDISQFIQKGGCIVAFTSWGTDTGSGLESYCSFITNEGEVITYQGQDFGNPDTISKTENKFITRPIGRKCMIRWGSDAIVITETGLKSLPDVVLGKYADSVKDVFNKNIYGAFQQASIDFKEDYGWMGEVWSQGNLGLVNIPNNQQFVVNLETGAWCRFDVVAKDWTTLSGKFYFGTEGGIARFGESLNDNGEVIRSSTQTAFSQMGTMARKQWSTFTPYILSNANLLVDYAFATDYKKATASFSTSTGTGFDWSYTQPVLWQSGTTLNIYKNSKMSDDATTTITLASNISKVIGAWVVGDGNGSGATSDDDYYVYLITDGLTVDVYLDTSLTPTLPAGYTNKARIKPNLNSETVEVSGGAFVEFADESDFSFTGEFWNQGEWFGGKELTLVERSINGYGQYGSLILNTETNQVTIDWMNTLFEFVEAGR